MATYPTPTEGQFNAPWFQAFLAEHPVLRGLDSARERNRFLDAHPNIAQRWTRLLAGPQAQTPTVATTPDTPTTNTPATTEPVDTSAITSLREALGSYGLGDVAEWAWGRFLEGAPTEEILLQLRTGKASDPKVNAAYSARFSGLAELRAKGRAISEPEYIALERQFAQIARSYGIPATFYDGPEDFGKLIGGEVAPTEYAERLDMAARVASTSEQGRVMRSELSRLYQDVGLNAADVAGAVTAYFIDPTKAEDILRKQVAAAEAATASVTTGFGSLTQAQAERVSELASAEQARAGFSRLATMDELRTPGIGDAGDEGLSSDDLIGAAFAGDSDATAKVERTARRRVAAFEGGGSFAASNRGVTGLGTA